MNYEWTTIFVVRHEAGSNEGAIFQRNAWNKLIDSDGGEDVMAHTAPGDAGMTGLGVFLGLAGDDDD